MKLLPGVLIAILFSLDKSFANWCGYSNPIQISYHGEACECPKAIPFQIDVPKIQKDDCRLTDYGYKIENPSRPAPQVKYTFDFHAESPKPQKGIPLFSYGYKLEVPSSQKKTQPKYNYDFQIEVPKPNPQSQLLKDLVARVDRVMIQREDCTTKPDTQCTCHYPIIDTLRPCSIHGLSNRYRNGPLPINYDVNRYDVIRRKRDTDESNLFGRFGRNIKSKLDSNLYKVTNDFSKKNVNADGPVLRRNKIPRIFEKIGNRKTKRGVLLRHKRNVVEPTIQHTHAYQAPNQYSCQPFAIPLNYNNYYQSYYLEPEESNYPKQNYQEKPINERIANEYPEEYYLDKIQNALYSKPNFVKGDELNEKLTIGPLKQAQEFVEFIKDISHGKYNQIVNAETISNIRPKKSNLFSEEAPPPLTIIPLESKKENVNYLKKSLFREDSEKKENKNKSNKKSSKSSSQQFSSLEQTLLQSESGETYLIKILSDNDNSDKENKSDKFLGKNISHESLLKVIKNGERF